MRSIHVITSEIPQACDNKETFRQSPGRIEIHFLAVGLLLVAFRNLAGLIADKLSRPRGK